MKKTAKIILAVCCTALVLFLLLPFLETQAPQKAGQTNAQANAEPQIFTSNPLTELVGRIARFFGARGKSSAQDAPQQLTSGQADEMFGQPQENALYASANASENKASSQTVTSEGGAYIDAYLQNEEGEWVLIHQQTPDGATRGMHEINAKDNAYDRYITQERQARFTPVMRIRAKQEVPNSRLARMFNPIKRFFGFGEDAAPAGALQAGEDAGRFAAGKPSSNLDKYREKSSTLPNMRPVNWEQFANNPFAALVPGGAEAAEQLLNLLNPAAEIDNTAEWLADMKYPKNGSPEQQEEKENFRKQWRKEKREQAFREMQELMVRSNAGKEPVNVLEATFSCGDGSVSKNTCGIGSDNGQPEQPDIAGIKELSKAQFFEQTSKHLPPAGITVVINSTELPVADPDVLSELGKPQQQAGEFYYFMQEQCQDNCYWVATGADKMSDLAQTIEAVGLTLKGDPLNRYEQYAQAYLAEQKQRGASEEQLQELQSFLENNKTHYVAYPQGDLDQISHDTMDLFKHKARPEDGAVPFFTHVQNAYDFYQRTNHQYPLFYGQGSAVDGDKPLEERAEALTGELSQFVNNVTQIRQKIDTGAAQEGTRAQVQPAVQQIQEQLKRDMDTFNRTNDLGKTQK